MTDKKMMSILKMGVNEKKFEERVNVKEIISQDIMRRTFYLFVPQLFYLVFNNDNDDEYRT